MKKLALTLLTIFTVTTQTHAATESIFRVSKNKNAKNVLHYKVDYNEATCEFTSSIYAQWKMDEENGQWKPLTDSPFFIKGPLTPKTSVANNLQIDFVTDSMSEFQQRGILTDNTISVRIAKAPQTGCEILNETIVQGQTIDLSEIKTEINWRGTVKSVTVIGSSLNKSNYVKTFR